MTKTNNKFEMRIGEFLVDNGIISQRQLKDALDMQKDNRERLIGEILVTQGVLSKEDLIMAFEMYLMTTGINPERVNEWLDQEEIDLILERFQNK